MNIKILDSLTLNQKEGVGNLYPSLIIVVGMPIIRALHSFSNGGIK